MFGTIYIFAHVPNTQCHALLVERRKVHGSARVAKPFWLAWVGEQMPILDEVWRLYLRRFTIDHWYRFLKQRLHWTLPKIATPLAVRKVE